MCKSKTTCLPPGDNLPEELEENSGNHQVIRTYCLTNVCTKICANPSRRFDWIGENCDLLVAQYKQSGDHQNDEDSSSGHHG